VLVGGNWLKFVSKVRGKIVIAGVHHGSDKAEKLSSLMNLWQAIKYPRPRLFER